MNGANDLYKLSELQATTTASRKETQAETVPRRGRARAACWRPQQSSAHACWIVSGIEMQPGGSCSRRRRQLQQAQAAAQRSCAYLRCANAALQGGPAAGQGEGTLRCSSCRVAWYW